MRKNATGGLGPFSGASLAIHGRYDDTQRMSSLLFPAGHYRATGAYVIQRVVAPFSAETRAFESPKKARSSPAEGSQISGEATE